MAASHSSATLDAMWKKTYGSDLVDLIPSSAKLLKKYAFAKGVKVGDEYVQPVIVSRSHGHSRGRGLINLNAAVVSQTKQAKVNPMPDYLRESISYDAAARMVENDQSFKDWSKYLVKSMYESMAYRTSIEMLYGQSGIGQADGSTNTDTTTTVIDLVAAQFAPLIWSGAENAKLKFYDAATLVSSGDDAVFTVGAVDVDTKKVTVSGTATGIAALDTALSTKTLDIFWSDGCSAAKGDLENAGFYKILTNASTLFEIDASQYALWKGNTHTAGGADLTMKKSLQAVAKCVGRGLNGDVTLWVNPTTFENMNSDQSALRTYDSSYKQSKAESGSERLVYVGQAGRIVVEPCGFVKESHAFVIPDKGVKRLGSTDITFKLPGDNAEKIFLHLPDQNGYELRCMSEQAYFIETPAQACLINNIVNS